MEAYAYQTILQIQQKKWKNGFEFFFFSHSKLIIVHDLDLALVLVGRQPLPSPHSLPQVLVLVGGMNSDLYL